MLSVKNLTIELKSAKPNVLVNNVSFSLKKDRCLGILGESGSGKSLTCNAINGLLGDNFSVSGEILFNKTALLDLPDSERRAIRGNRIAMVVQSPMTAFNPLFTIESQAVDTIKQHKALTNREAIEQFHAVLNRLNLSETKALVKKYPHELSGGMLQRIMIALALVLKPELLIADEPTTAIDYVSQQEVVKELQFVREQFGTSLIFVSHDLSLISHIADDVLVMQAGKVVEYGPTAKVFNHPEHPYTRYLIDTRLALINRFSAMMRGAPC